MPSRSSASPVALAIDLATDLAIVLPVALEKRGFRAERVRKRCKRPNLAVGFTR